MVSRLRYAAAFGVLLAVAALSTAACEKVPLLAPSGSSITLTVATTALPANGTTQIIAQIIEASGNAPHSGTHVTFTTNLGRIEPAEAETDVSGRAVARFVAGGTSGTATIGAISGGTSVSGANAVKVLIGAAAVGGVQLSASPSTLGSSGGLVALTATVIDAGGNPLPGVQVTFGIDTATAGSSGTLGASTVVTDTNGQAQTTLATSRTTTVTATAGLATAGSGTGTGAAATSAQTAKVTVTVNTTSTLTIGTPSPATPNIGQPVTIPLTYGTSTTASPLTRVRVDWGDGRIEEFPGQPSSVSHAYNASASYLIRATGFDAFNDAVTANTSVTVTRLVTAVNLTVNPTTGTRNVTSFTYTATITSASLPAGVTVDHYEWNFGDGTTRSTGSNVTNHIYAVPGTQVTTVTVVLSDGTRSSASIEVVVT